jgi:hypothetical protein
VAITCGPSSSSGSQVEPVHRYTVRIGTKIGNPGSCLLTAPTRRTVPSGATSTRRAPNGAAGVSTATHALPDHRSTITTLSCVDLATSHGAYPGVPSRVSV